MYLRLNEVIFMFDERVLKTLLRNTPIGYAYFEVSYVKDKL